jgi:non-specific serine/threonine protein kinase
LLADGLGLSPEDRAAFMTAGRQRRVLREHNLVLLSRAATDERSGVLAIEASHPPRHNLPQPPTRLLGRERELAEVTALLRQDGTRLVTLTGPGGVGKTRLALEVVWAVHEAGEGFPDGIWFVPLAPLSEPALVIPNIARALGLTEQGGASINDLLRVFLRDKSLLLLLDNFEHVAEAAPQLAELLDSSAGLALLVTSRATLRLRGEKHYPVSLLAVPPSARGRPVTIEQLDQYAATALFIERARAAQPSFQVTDSAAPLVANICAQLNGLPLAIELAAAWSRLLPPAALATRLDRTLPLLATGPMDLPERQRTMHRTIAWSYDLLDAEDQRLFGRLAVFANGCALEAVEAVCQAPLGAEPLTRDVLEGLATLVDHSLALRREAADEARVYMLHIVREFALAQLEASEEADALRRSHARYFVELAEQIEPKSRGPALPAWLLGVERELGNIRAALGWARARGEVELGLRLATALWRFWFAGGHLSEGVEWLEGFLTLAGPDDTSLPAWLRARAYSDLGMLFTARWNVGPAMPHLEKGIALGRAAGDWLAVAVGLQFLGAAQRVTGHPEQAVTSYEEVLAMGRENNDALTTYTSLTSLGELAGDRGDWAAAAARYTAAMAISRATGHRDHVGSILLRLAEVALQQGEEHLAVACLREAIELFQAIGMTWAMIGALDLLATAHARMGAKIKAARMFGAAAHLRETIARPHAIGRQPRLDALIAPARAALSEGAWGRAFEAGRALTLEEMVSEALKGVPEEGESKGGAPPGDQAEREASIPAASLVGVERLTRRELEVLHLLVQGWSDAQIAAHLVLSLRTVNHHVAAIYGKLGVSSRAAATRYTMEHHLLERT